jgi:hypothetical protein
LVTGLHPTELSQQDLKIKFADRATHLNPNLIDWLEWMTEPSLDKRLSSAREAWISLKNPRTLDKIPMAVQRQGSDIKLTKNSEFIEIKIPPQGVGLGVIAMLAGAITANAKLFIYIAFKGDIDPQLLLLCCFLTALGGFKLLEAIIQELHFKIDRQQISCMNHLLDLTWNYSQPARRHDICKLEIEQIESTIPFTRQKLSRVSLIVQAGDQKYRLGEKQKLNEAEIEWLATELSQWLGLKIKRTLTYREFIRWYV